MVALQALDPHLILLENLAQNGEGAILLTVLIGKVKREPEAYLNLGGVGGHRSLIMLHCLIEIAGGGGFIRLPHEGMSMMTGDQSAHFFDRLRIIINAQI